MPEEEDEEETLPVTEETFVARFLEELRALTEEYVEIPDIHRAFAIRAFELHMQPSETLDAIDATKYDGSHDQGIDGFWVDTEGQVVSLFQFKCPADSEDWNPFEVTYDEAPIRELVDAYQLIRDESRWRVVVQDLRDRGFENNADLLQDLGEAFRSAVDAGYIVRLFAVLGGTLTAGGEAYLRTEPLGEQGGLHVISIEELYSFFRLEMVPDEPPPEHLDIEFIAGRMYFDEADQVVSGQIRARTLKELIRGIETQLFGANYRHFLGFRGKEGTVNSKIRRTLSDPSRRSRFHKYNNGIRMTCDRLEPLDTTLFRAHHPQIPNGGQTSVVIRKTPDDQLTDEVTVDIKVIVADEEMAVEIADATNTQTSIEGWDFHANEPLQRALLDQFTSVFIAGRARPHWWSIKRGEFEVRHPAPSDKRRYKIPGRPGRTYYLIRPADLSKASLAFRGDPVSSRSSPRLFHQTYGSGKYNEIFRTGVSVEEFIYHYYCFRACQDHSRTFARRYDEAVASGFVGIDDTDRLRLQHSRWLKYGATHLAAAIGYLYYKRYSRPARREILMNLMEDWEWEDSDGVGFLVPQDAYVLGAIGIVTKTLRAWASVLQDREDFDWSNFFKTGDSFEKMKEQLSSGYPDISDEVVSLLPEL